MKLRLLRQLNLNEVERGNAVTARLTLSDLSQALSRLLDLIATGDEVSMKVNSTPSRISLTLRNVEGIKYLAIILKPNRKE